MLKGNLLVGENQSVVLHATSLQGLLKLAESHCQTGDPLISQGRAEHQDEAGGIKLRIDLSDSSRPLEDLLSSDDLRTTLKNT